MPSVQFLLKLLEKALVLRGIRRRRVTEGGAPISYLEGGRLDGRVTFVLVHGLGSSAISWARVLAPLGRDARVLAPDLPAWGESAVPPGKDHADLNDLTQGLIRFLERVAGKPVVLVGQSMGGWVCVKVARQRPDLVERLVLVNSAGAYYPEVAELRKRLDVKDEEQVREFWGLMYHRQPRFYRYFKDDYVKKMHEPRVLRFFDSVQDEAAFVNADLPGIERPVSIIWGMDDRFIPRHTVDIFVRGLRHVDVHWVPACGHVPALERPKEFTRILKAVSA